MRISGFLSRRPACARFLVLADPGLARAVGPAVEDCRWFVDRSVHRTAELPVRLLYFLASFHSLCVVIELGSRTGARPTCPGSSRLCLPGGCCALQNSTDS